MRRRRLLWQFYPSYLLITLISLVAVTWYGSSYVRGFFLEHVRSELTARAHLVENNLLVPLGSGDMKSVDVLCKEIGRQTSTRVTVVLSSGKVVGDSMEDPARMDSHSDRPEVIEALAGKTGKSIRYSYTLQENMMYVAIPANDQGSILGVVRTAIPVTSIDRALQAIYLHIAVGGLVIALMAAALGFVVSRRISRPLEEMKRGAERFAQGDFRHPLTIPDSLEIGGLAGALNRMAIQIDEQLRTVVRQRNELEAVLSSMAEAVLAVDADEHIINLNNAAARLLGVVAGDVHGRSIQESIRHTDLQRFVARSLGSQTPVESDIVLDLDGKRTLQAHGTALRDAQGRNIGALIVLNDMTRLRHLENVRREFVANVSHELKTPITSIKGFVETLLDGAINNPEDARRFLNIIAKHADRLNAIIEDLLSLSKIEQEGERKGIALEEGSVRGVLQAAIQSCRVSAEAKNITMELTCEDDIRARINAPLFEQAIVNLLDNAIKYSEPGKTVEAEAVQANGEVVVQVRDHGYGIAKEHLPRLFERFYRVDKARSRKLGGTGLGLAIVKHIVQAHSGRVEVQSVLGEGSAFTIRLPASFTR